MGLLKLNPFSFPGVNAWATEKPFKSDIYQLRRPHGHLVALLQTENILFPFQLECVHISHAEDSSQSSVPRRIIFLLVDELAIKLHQQSFLLEVITKITGLRVIRALVIVVERTRIE